MFNKKENKNSILRKDRTPGVFDDCNPVETVARQTAARSGLFVKSWPRVIGRSSTIRMGYAVTVFTYVLVGGAKYFHQFHPLIVAIHYFLKQ